MALETAPDGIAFNATGDISILGGVFVHGNQNVITNNAYSPRRDASWDHLHAQAASNAMHDSDTLVQQGICMENTREAVLKLLSDDLSSTEPNSPSILWLNGPAGAGKSAIARTIARSTAEEQTLLGNFFFYQADSTRNTIKPLIPTLAVQVCRKFLQARRIVEQAIADDPFIFSKPTRAQATALIVGPLKKTWEEKPLQSLESTPLVILVDGLDECNEPERQLEVIDTLVDIVTSLNASASLRLKVVIFSRPEIWIRKHITTYEHSGRVRSVTLDDELNPQSDIELYYTTHFEKLRSDHPKGRTLGPNWPSAEDTKILLEMTGTHFAFAHVIGIFTSDPNEDPKLQLEVVLRIGGRPPNSPDAYLDQLYNTIFSRVPKSILPQTLRVVGAILVPSPYALYPSPFLLELVFSLQEGEIHHIFSHLESLFTVGNRVSSWIQVHHRTLSDFLFNASRSRQYGLFLDERAVCKDIRASVRSVFFLQTMPQGLALRALGSYLSTLEYKGPSLRRFWGWLPSVLHSPLIRILNPTQPEWAPWAIAWTTKSTFSPWRIPILHKLIPPSPREYARYIAKPGGLRDLERILSIYERSPLGRFCLVAAEGGFLQLYDDAVASFYQAFIRHAILSDPTLPDHDRSTTWNLITCDPNTLATTAIYFRSLPWAYQLDIVKQVADDALDPEWPISRLGMLSHWHEGGHQSGEDPWKRVVQESTINTASNSQLQCAMCLEVLDICKGRILCKLISSGLVTLESTFQQKLFQHIQGRPTLWNDGGLLDTWVDNLQRDKKRLASDPHMARIASCALQQHTTLDEASRAATERLVADGWDFVMAESATWYPYTRACIPLNLSEAQAVRSVLFPDIRYDRVELPYWGKIRIHTGW